MATAASTAEPPARSTLRPASTASGSAAATITVGPFAGAAGALWMTVGTAAEAASRAAKPKGRRRLARVTWREAPGGRKVERDHSGGRAWTTNLKPCEVAGPWKQSLRTRAPAPAT